MAAKVPISRRALEQRIDRALKQRGEFLRKCRRDSPSWRNLGDYFTVNVENHVAATDVDLGALAEELGVLKPWESLAEGDQ